MASSLNGTGITFSDASTQSTARTTSNTVTSVAAGNGITVSATVGAVTISQDVYNGTNYQYASYPVGAYLLLNRGAYQANSSFAVWSPSSSAGPGYFGTSSQGAGSASCAGTWRARGSANGYCAGSNPTLMQRTA